MQSESEFYHAKLHEAATKVAEVTDRHATLEEDGVKSNLAYAFRHSDWCGVAEAIVEAAEWAVAHVMLCKAEHTTASKA